MSLKYEPSSEPLQVVCNIKAETQDLAALKGDFFFFFFNTLEPRVE